MAETSALVVAAGSGRVALLAFRGDELCDWRVSEKAAEGPEAGAAVAEAWIARYKPRVFVCEAPGAAPHKGQRSRAIVAAMAGVARQKGCLIRMTTRPKLPKQMLAEEMAARHPELAPWLPKKRRIWDTEPWNMVLFEAMALAEAARHDPAGGSPDAAE